MGIGAAFDTIKARPEERVAEKKRDQLDIAKKWFADEEKTQNATLNDTQNTKIFDYIKTAPVGQVKEKVETYLKGENITSALSDV